MEDAAVHHHRLPRSLRIVLISIVLVAAVGSSLAFVTGTYRINPEPGTIHVFGTDYSRFGPCCQGETWSHGSQPMAVASTWLRTTAGDEPIVVWLSDPWGRFGFADSDARPPFPPCRVLLKEGLDAYFPYARSGGCGA